MTDTDVARSRQKPPPLESYRNPLVVFLGDEVTDLSIGVHILEPRSYSFRERALIRPPISWSQVAPGYFLPATHWFQRNLQVSFAPGARMVDWNVGTLLRLNEVLRVSLGEVLDDVMLTHYRGVRSHTPPGRVHRLAELLYRLSPWTYLYEPTAKPDIDPAPVAELYAYTAIISRAARESIWSTELRNSCRNPVAFLHTIITLLTCDALERSVTPVSQLRITSSDTREPDINARLQGHDLHMEVKVPDRLIRFDQLPDSAESKLSDAEAANIVDRTFESAVGTWSGQIRRDRPGVLTIGGFHLQSDAVKALENAAHRKLVRVGARYNFVTAIAINFMSLMRAFNLEGAVRVAPVFQLIPNPHATAPILLDPQPYRAPAAPFRWGSALNPRY